MLEGAFSVQSVGQLGRFERRKMFLGRKSLLSFSSQLPVRLRVRYHPLPTFPLLRLDLVASDFWLARISHPDRTWRSCCPSATRQPFAPPHTRRALAAFDDAACQWMRSSGSPSTCVISLDPDASAALRRLGSPLRIRLGCALWLPSTVLLAALRTTFGCGGSGSAGDRRQTLPRPPPEPQDASLLWLSSRPTPGFGFSQL